MEIAHLAAITPHRSGLYETTRDLVAAERILGIDARIIDPLSKTVDRGVPIFDNTFINNCDIIVSHSGVGDYIKLNKPIIHVLHGRPYNSFLLESGGGTPVYSYIEKIAKNDQFKYFVTFWEEYYPIWNLIIPKEKLKSVNAPVDLDFWTPDGPSGYKFKGKGGKINIVCADPWREDKNIYHMLNAFWHFASKIPAKLHIYGCETNKKGLSVLLNTLKSQGTLGEVCGWVKGLENVYRAADLVITPHSIATRTVRESLACGCKSVGGLGNKYTTLSENPEDVILFKTAMIDVLGMENKSREMAVKSFDSKKTANEFLVLFENILS